MNNIFFKKILISCVLFACTMFCFVVVCFVLSVAVSLRYALVTDKGLQRDEFCLPSDRDGQCRWATYAETVLFPVDKEI